MVYRVVGLEVSPSCHLVKVNGQDIALTLKEFELLCLLLAVLGWVLFRAEDLPAAGRYFACLFGGAAGASAQARLYLHDFWPVLLLGAVGATPLCAKLAGRLGAKLQPGVRAAVQAVLVLALLACSTVWLLNGSFQSFVYFQF